MSSLSLHMSLPGQRLNLFYKLRKVFCLGLLSAIWLVPVHGESINKPIEIFVSILPQKTFVQSVGGDKVNVHVMVGPGQSPATYEPTPRQMTKLAQADIYFRIGTPFEDVWMDRLRASNPSLRFIDARDTINLKDNVKDKVNDKEYREPSADNSTHHHGLKDPHIWTNPLNVKNFMQHFTGMLAAMYPDHKALFENNYREFAAQLDELDSKIKTIFHNNSSKEFLVFHPSWGYFADRYGLTQIAIELKGKTPNAKELASVVDYAKQRNINRVFVQEQFSKKEAQAVANAINGKVIAVDPLAEDYINNLLEVAQKISGDLR